MVTRSQHPATLGVALALASLILVVLLPRALDAQEVRGSAFLETRLFPSSPAFPDQQDATISPSVGLEPEFIWESDAGSIQFRVKPFLRWDADDDNRTHVDLREATVLYLANGWTLFAGAGKVFWEKTEAHHLVDIINQTDGVEDIDTEDKLGQPMINFTLERDWGTIDFFVLPYFRERTHPDERARLRGAFPVARERRVRLRRRSLAPGRRRALVLLHGQPGSRRVGLPWDKPGAALGTGDDEGRTRACSRCTRSSIKSRSMRSGPPGRPCGSSRR